MLQSNDVIGMFMNKCVNSYANIKNIVQSQTRTLNPFVPIFIIKNDMQENETITSNRTDGNFRLSGDCFCSTSAEPRCCVNSPLRDRKIPSAPVTGERFL